jgi:hypothetical protein
MLGLHKYEFDAKDISKKNRMKRKFSKKEARIEPFLGYEKTPVFMELPKPPKIEASLIT